MIIKKHIWTLFAWKDFELFIVMWLNLNHLQCSHLVRAVHVEPEAQVTQTHTGWKWTPGCYLGNVTLPLNGGVYVQKFPSATFGNTVQMINMCQGGAIFQNLSQLSGFRVLLPV